MYEIVVEALAWLAALARGAFEYAREEYQVNMHALTGYPPPRKRHR